MKNKILIITIAIITIILIVIIVGVYMKPEIRASEALVLANQAVSEYGIIFDNVTKQPATIPEHTSSLINDIDECDFSDYNYDQAWEAEKDMGERKIDGKNYNVSIYVHVGFDGRVCKSAKFTDIIPGVIPIERVI